jgi:hypothetical protein
MRPVCTLCDVGPGRGITQEKEMELLPPPLILQARETDSRTVRPNSGVRWAGHPAKERQVQGQTG